jgi:hypothetical protein
MALGYWVWLLVAIIAILYVAWPWLSDWWWTLCLLVEAFWLALKDQRRDR